jgi:hypothetical protein
LGEWRACVVVTGALSLLALVGCTEGAEQSRSPSAVEPRDALLTKEEAVSLGAPPSIEDIEPLAASERHSEPLGPCGAELDHNPSYDEDQIAIFSTIDPRPFGLTHEVWVVPQDDAENHMDDLSADTEIGCDPFQVG